MTRNHRAVLVATAGTVVCLLSLSPVARAVSTRTWVSTTYPDFDAGVGKGVLVSGRGDVETGHAQTRQDLAATLAYTALVAPNGTVYLGTGDTGEVWAEPAGQKPRRIAKVDDTRLVASLALGPGGELFAGTVGAGRIVTIDPATGTVKTFVSLDGAEHVWGLAYDAARRTLYAATGPEGKLYAVDAGGHARVLWDSDEAQLLSLARGADGALYVGSANDAILYRVDPATGQARALHDFAGDEVRAIALRGATAYVVVNQFERQKGQVPGPAPSKDSGTKITDPKAGQPGAAAPLADSPIPRPGAAKGKGAVFRVDADGRVEQLHALADGYFTSVAVDADGTVWAGAGSSGKVFEIRPDRTVLTALDLPERQVLAILPLASGGSHLVATGDAAALYTVDAGPPVDAQYTSKTFDAGFVSRWGTVDWRGDGTLTVETRSGNTGTPDKTWSPWQAPAGPSGVKEGVGKVQSPAARYLQYRVHFPRTAATLREVTVYYLPQNQRPVLSDLQVGDAPSSRSGDPITTSDAPKARSGVVKITWKADDPDDDDLVYRVYYREEGETDWRPLAPPSSGGDPLTDPKLDWDTTAVPDGRYEIRVVASDEADNPADRTLTDEKVSPPYLVDNRKPDIADLTVAYPNVSGRARDSFSRIAEISYAVDGGDFHLVFPRDGLFDDPVEEFSVRLGTLAPGAHVLEVRAADEAGNIVAAQQTFRVR